MKRPLLTIYLSFLLCLIVLSAQAVVRNAVASGNFNTASTWSPAGVPATGDVLIIGSPYNVTMNLADVGWSTTYSITINNGGTLTRTGNLTFNGGDTPITVNTGGKLNVSGKLTINQSMLTIAGGEVSAGSFEAGGGVNITSGKLAVTNELRVNGGAFTSSAGTTTTAGSLNVTSSGGTSYTNSGTATISGAATISGEVTNSGSLSTGAITMSGDSRIYNNSVMTVTGNVTIPSSSKFYTNPSATSLTTVTGNVTTNSNQNLIIGTSANPGPYANFLITGNLVSTGSGDVLIDKNGRLAVYGNFTANGGGSIFTINDGGQVYINGTISMNGGGNHITNNNDGNPYYGFYSPNQPQYSGGGSGSDGAAGSNTVQPISQMPTEFKDWVSDLPNSPLPIKLLYFKVSAVNETGIALEWATSMEKDFSHFEVQRASSDLNFSVIGIVEGRGSLQAKTVYSLLDNSPVSGKNYYRLKAVDVDGSSEYFTVIVAEWSGSLGLSLYPNPAVNKSFSINIGDEFDQPVNLVVYEARGIAIYSASLDVKTKVVELPSDTAPGVYLVRIGSPAKNKVVRLVVE